MGQKRQILPKLPNRNHTESYDNYALQNTNFLFNFSKQILETKKELRT